MLKSNAVNLRTVALPAEHGGWGFLLEPIVLGLLVRPSSAGLGLALGVTGMFLARQPLRMMLTDWQRRRRFARTALAERVAALYVALAAAGLLAAVMISGPGFLLPLALATPLVLIQLYYDFTRRSRSILPELAGPLALASVAAGIALAGGWTLTPALALWVILAARCLPSVLYVRARLRLEHGQPAPAWPALLAQAVGLLVVLGLYGLGLSPLAAAAALLALLLRAALGLSSWRAPTPARIIGLREMAYGALVVLAAALGYAGTIP